MPEKLGHDRMTTRSWKRRRRRGAGNDGTSDSFSETCRILYDSRDKEGQAAALISVEVIEFVRGHAAELDAAGKYERDGDYDYFGCKTPEKS